MTRLTSNLNTVRNDTGRIAFCGPTVLSAITGFSVSKVEAAIHAYRDDPVAARKIIEGTTAEEVAAALDVYGYRMDLVDSFWDYDRRERPSVWTWMQRGGRNPWAHYILAIHRGKDGHWICIKGTKLCDTYTSGEWVFASTGPHRGARIMEVYQVRRGLAVDEPPSGISD